MKVNIEVQYICDKQENLRGVPYYIINLVESLVKRKQNIYELSFFDFQKERNNRKYIYEYLSKDLLKCVSLNECNTISYKEILDALSNNDMHFLNSFVYKECMQSKADIYHIPTAHAVCPNMGGKTVITVHDIIPLMPDKIKNAQSAITMHLKQSMDIIKEDKDMTIITVSESSKKDIIDYIGIEDSRIYVVPEACDKEIHHPESNQQLLLELGIDSSYILYLGTIDARKGVVEIIEAFNEIKEYYNDLKLVLAGYFREDAIEVRKCLLECKYIKDIIILGFVNDQQKRVLLSSAEAFLFPSEYEGFGLPVLEAMACGSPVITTDVSSLPEVGGDSALYVEPNNSEELAEKIRQVLDSSSFRQEMIEKGFMQIEKFSWNETARLTEEIYKTII